MSRVLVVDDNDTIATLLTRNLTDAGHDVAAVSIHLESLLNPGDLHWLGVDILIADLWMPKVSGLQILTVAQTYFPNIRRVAFTALLPEDRAVKVAAEVAEVILHKPEDVLRIAEVVEELA